MAASPTLHIINDQRKARQENVLNNTRIQKKNQKNLVKMEIVCRLCALVIEQNKTRYYMNENIERKLTSTCAFISVPCQFTENNLWFMLFAFGTILEFPHFCCKSSKGSKKAFSFELPKSKVIDDINGGGGEIGKLVELSEVNGNSVQHFGRL